MVRQAKLLKLMQASAVSDRSVAAAVAAVAAEPDALYLCGYPAEVTDGARLSESG